MCGRVVGGARLVVSRGDDAALMLDHGTNGHLVLFPGLDGLIVGVGHIVVGIAVEFRWKDLFKWAVHFGSWSWEVWK